MGLTPVDDSLMEGVEVAGESEDGFDIEHPDVDPDAEPDLDLLDMEPDLDLEDSFDPLEVLGLDNIPNDDNF